MVETASIAQGLGALSNLPTPFAGAFAGAAAVLGALGGPGEAIALNPYSETDRLFAPGGALWGAPLTSQELAARSTSSAIAHEGQNPADVAGAWLARQRGTWLGTGGFRIVAVAATHWRNVTSRAAAPPRSGSTLRVSVINALVAGYSARQSAMLASSSPSFHYIDTRTWGEAEFEYWARSVTVGSADAPGGGSPLSIAKWRKTKAAKDARDLFELLRSENLAKYDAESANWEQWRANIAQAAAEQAAKASLSDAIQAYLDSSPDPVAATQAILSGHVPSGLSSYLASSGAPAAALASMQPDGAPDASSSKGPLLALVAVVALLLATE